MPRCSKASRVSDPREGTRFSRLRRWFTCVIYKAKRCIPASTSMKSLLFAFLAACVLSLASSASAQIVFTPEFPSGVDWTNATPDQISEAVYNAVKENPEQAVEITQAAIEMAKNTGRFPSLATADGKQFLDPNNTDPTGTIEDVAQRIGNSAKQANPAMAPMIDAAVMSAVPTVGMLASLPGTGGGSGTGTGGGTGGSTGSVPLPSGFGGGGGGGTVTEPAPTPRPTATPVPPDSN